MKKALCILLACCLLLGAAPLAIAADTVTVDAGWSVLLPASPTSYEQFAAEKLRSTLSEVFGKEVQTITQPEGRYIAVGAASKADVSAVGDNGYRIQVIDGNVHIGGTAQRGLQIGVYRFLETFRVAQNAADHPAREHGSGL